MIDIINKDLSPLSQLSLDLIESILHFLPPKSLARFKSVSKRWYSLISSPDFIKTHIQKLNKNNPNPDPTHLILRSYVVDDDSLYSLDIKQLSTQTTPTTVTAKPLDLHLPKPRLRLLGSCNGLVLACDASYNLYLVNPTTKKTLKVLVGKQWATYGFGYDSSKDDYKILLIPDFGIMPNPDFNPDNKFVVHLGYSNNNLHFIVGRDLEISIAAFCLADEEFHVIEFPKIVKHDDKTCSELLTLGEKLAAVICVRCHDRIADYELWVMEEYGVPNSWKKLCDIENDIDLDDEFFASISNRDILVGNSDSDEICIYNMDESRYTSVKVKRCSQDFLVEGVYVESFESLERFC
ncbi:F-box protein CPR1-like [Rutidosis leptorrhynchoides]|uniref:F-box protein CPR1-like n=1 Tax=Rutidosis leptorrhynchoides TaxID=125765 RepID=UPI003A9A5964